MKTTKYIYTIIALVFTAGCSSDKIEIKTSEKLYGPKITGVQMNSEKEGDPIDPKNKEIIYALKLYTTYPVTIVELKSGAGFRLADTYKDPVDSSAREGIVINSYQDANIGVGRQIVSIAKKTNDDNPVILTVAILTHDLTIDGELSFPGATKGDITLTIGKAPPGKQVAFTTSGPSNASFSLNIDTSMGRPKNESE